MRRKLEPEVKAMICKLFRNKMGYRKIQKKLLEENIKVSLSGIQRVCKRLEARSSTASASTIPHRQRQQKKCPVTTKIIQKVTDVTSQVNPTLDRIDHDDDVELQITQTAKNQQQNCQNVGCIICTKLFQKNHESCDNPVNLKFENNVESFCRLFSLPSNYFHAELKVSNVTLVELTCNNCREMIELISSVYSEIGKLKKRLVQLKKSVETDLSRVAIEDFKDEFKIREKLQQKLNISTLHSQVEDMIDNETNDFTDLISVNNESTVNFDEDVNIDPITVTIIQNSENPDDDTITFQNVDFESVDHIDETLFDSASAPASPVNSNYEADQDCASDAEGSPTVMTLEQIKEEADEEISNLEETSSNQLGLGVENDLDYVQLTKSGTTSGQNPCRKIIDSEQDPRVKDCSVMVTRLNMTIWELDQAEVEENQKKAHACEYCDKSYSSISSLRSHQSTAHAKQFSFICDICGVGLKHQAYLDQHKRRHVFKAENIQFQCRTCKAGFKSREDYTEHKKIHPFVRIKKTCEFCGKLTPTVDNLLRHQRKHHGLPYPYYCSICNMGHHTLKYLQNHEAYHKAERNFRCQICPAEFPLQKALDRHMLSHESSQRFQCELCPSNYKNKHGLKLHMIVHSGERPWICEVCGMSFPFKDKLKNHSSIHTAERPHLCTECGFSCRTKGLLTSHMKVHEMHRKLRENAAHGSDDEGASKKLPVPRLAKPRNRRLKFPKIKTPTLIPTEALPAVEAEPEVVPEPQTDQQLSVVTEITL